MDDGFDVAATGLHLFMVGKDKVCVMFYCKLDELVQVPKPGLLQDFTWLVLVFWLDDVAGLASSS